MNLIDESIILSAAKSYSKIGETNRYDCDKLDAFIQGAFEAQQQLQPFIVELLDWTSQNYTSSDGIHCKIGNTGIDNWITSEQLLEEFINSKTK